MKPESLSSGKDPISANITRKPLKYRPLASEPVSDKAKAAFREMTRIAGGSCRDADRISREAQYKGRQILRKNPEIGEPVSSSNLGRARCHEGRRGPR